MCRGFSPAGWCPQGRLHFTQAPTSPLAPFLLQLILSSLGYLDWPRPAHSEAVVSPSNTC